MEVTPVVATLDDVVQELRSVDSSVQTLSALVIGGVLFVLVVLNAKPADTNSVTVYAVSEPKSGGRLEAERPAVFTAIVERQEVLFEQIGDAGPISFVQQWGKSCAVQDPQNWICNPSKLSHSMPQMREGRLDYLTLNMTFGGDALGRWVWHVGWLDWWLVKHGMRPPWVHFDPSS